MILTTNNLYQVAPNDVQAQYRESNINTLIQGISDIKKLFIENGFLSLKNDNLNITTAKQDGLDAWGNLLNFYRHIPSDTDYSQDIQYFNFNSKNFRRLQFINPNYPNYTTLSDYYFRRFLVLIYQSMFIIETNPSLVEFVNAFFEGLETVKVRDNLDMSFDLLVMLDESSYSQSFIKYIIRKYDIILRPAGVKMNLIDIPKARRFGFIPKDNTDQWFFNNIGAFNNTNFSKIGE